jgi:tetratricopeptide (TPR) repeat protein
MVLFAASGTLAAHAAASGPSPMPRAQSGTGETPEQRAQAAYDAGVRSVNNADSLAAAAAGEADAARQRAFREKSRAGYKSALGRFEKAAKIQPSAHEAWNYIGYCRRKLGDHTAALAAYDQALALSPRYAPALEYRGEAYLALDRVAEAKRAYLDLFASDRKLAGELLAAMRAWLAQRQAQRGSLSPDALQEFGEWLSEREQIARQTASLTRSGAEASWR